MSQKQIPGQKWNKDDDELPDGINPFMPKPKSQKQGIWGQLANKLGGRSDPKPLNIN